MSLEPPTLDSAPKLPAFANDVTLKMYYVQCLAAGTYIVAHEGFAFIVDPLRDVDQYINFLDEHKLRLKGVLLSHAHADYLGGHCEMSRRTNAAIFFGYKVPPPPNVSESRPRVPVHEGDVLHLSSVVRAVAMETPGHTPGCITWVLEKLEGGQWAKLAAFTGDSLFIGSCGRPDLAGMAGLGVTSEQMAQMMHSSLQRFVRELPPTCLILPAHGAGSPCGKSMSDKLFDTMEGQLGKLKCGRPANTALRTAIDDTSTDAAAFIEFLIGSGTPAEQPDYFLACIVRNFGCAVQDLEEQKADIQQRDCAWLAEAMRSGDVMIIDVREPDQHMPCHVKDSYNFALGTHGGVVLGHEDGNFGLWLGTMFKWRDQKVVLIVDKERRDEAMNRISRVGVLKQIIATVDGTDLVANGKANGLDMVSCKRWEAEDIKQAAGLRFIDVRTPGEFQCPKNGTIKDALNVPLSPAIEQAAEEARLEKGTKYLCFCIGGFRSAIAVSFLRRAGYTVEDIKRGYLEVTENLPEMTTAPTKKPRTS